MQEIVKFLKDCGTFYLATEEAGQPRVRPFGALNVFEDKLYLITGNNKDVYRQMIANPKVELSGMVQDRWMRLTGELKLDDRREARVAMLEENEALKAMYQPDDGVMAVLYFTKGTATFSSFTEEPKTVTL